MNLPNKITFFRIALIPFFLFFSMPAPAWYQQGLIEFLESAGPFFAVSLFIIAGITDIIDGKIARKHNLVTNLGKFLDPIADKLLVISALMVLVLRYDLSILIVIIIIARELMVMGIRMVAAGEGVVVSASILGKIKTVIQIIAIVGYLLNEIVDRWYESGIFLGQFVNNVFDKWYLEEIVMMVAVLITIISGIDYLVKNIKFLKSAKN